MEPEVGKTGKNAPPRKQQDKDDRESIKGYVSAYDIAIVYAGLGDNDQAMAWLGKAFSERSMFLVHLTWDARLDTLHTDPRFAEIVKQLGFPAPTPQKGPVA